MTTHVNLERMITFLLETPMFEALDPVEIKQLTKIIEVKEYAPGETLFHEGDVGDAWYALYRGQVDVVKDEGTGEKEIYPLGVGACFGEIALLDGQPRSATIKAIDPSVALTITRAAFEKLLNENDPVAYKLLHHMAISLAHRVRSTTERLSELVDAAEAGQFHQGVTQLVSESQLGA